MANTRKNKTEISEKEIQKAKDKVSISVALGLLGFWSADANKALIKEAGIGAAPKAAADAVIGGLNRDNQATINAEKVILSAIPVNGQVSQQTKELANLLKEATNDELKAIYESISPQIKATINQHVEKVNSPGKGK